MYLSARAISQSATTRAFLSSIKQDGKSLPDGPIVISPDGMIPSLYREGKGTALGLNFFVLVVCKFVGPCFCSKTLFEQHKLGGKVLPDGPIVGSPDGMDASCTEEPTLDSSWVQCLCSKCCACMDTPTWTNIDACWIIIASVDRVLPIWELICWFSCCYFKFGHLSSMKPDNGDVAR